jgi:DNA-binding NtrC family response regulator
MSDHWTVEIRWQTLLQQSSDPLFLLGPERRLLFVNQAWEELTGLPPGQALGLACTSRAFVLPDLESALGDALSPPEEVWQGQFARKRHSVVGLAPDKRDWEIDFLPIRTANRVGCILGRIGVRALAGAAPRSQLPDELQDLRKRVRQRHTLDRRVSATPAAALVVKQIRLASQVRANVLLVGEKGAGKHWSARAIHEQSPASERAFVSLDCRRLPPGAVADFLTNRSGLLLWEDVGTLYLQEPHHMPRDLQARLVDILEPSSLPPGKETATSSASTITPRLVAGFAFDPAEQVRSGRLLADLHARLATLVIELPPLRERRADLPDLIEQLLPRASGSRPAPIQGLTPESWQIMKAYPWPGNLDELLAVLTDAATRAPGDRIEAAHLPAYLRLAVRLDQTPGPEKERIVPMDEILEQAEKRLILLALGKCGENKTRAAELLAIWRPRLLRRMEALGLEAGSSPPENADHEQGARKGKLASDQGKERETK